ncbi:hypothetical protein [Virgisporangium aurantiacum]|uniref:Uncharacterized protein n=1 Tax=Virgisporangium aurantiacum TaxID=175570 RepID=A0A8J3ZMV8_9ACTN|nr:hypothetical protein [Virgisporangium aurantiacum]GIJ64370.1 hypothetical protein Vau01_118860 [Virgisporangium aurantiacum]
MRSTINQAFREMRGLRTTDAGRLRGVHLRNSSLHPPHRALAGTPQPWRDQLQAAIQARDAGTVTPDSPEYLVISDGAVIAVLTAAAHVVIPDYPLSTLQARHQRAAADAVNDLHRHTLRDLADRRATRDGRDDDVTAEYEAYPDGALRVAALHDMTNTRWVHISADLAQTRNTVCTACGVADPQQVVIVTAVGYGKYGRDRHRLDLDLLATMHEIADEHHVSLRTVGDWLDASGATTATDIEPCAVREEFAAAYIGPFQDEREYTRHRMAELGWTHAIRAAGIPASYLDIGAINRDWFSRQVRGVESGTWGRIEVFRRGVDRGDETATAEHDTPPSERRQP